MRKVTNERTSKTLPTFRAGGIVTRRTPAHGTGDIKPKTALSPTYYSVDHFSSPMADVLDPMSRRTRVIVKVLEGKDLLVSDLPTGTSDPVALLWIGPAAEERVDVQRDKRVQSTQVRKHTVDPVWDAEFVFPLEVECLEDVLGGRLNILVRDHDDADGDVHYLDLGRVSVSLENVLLEGNVMAHTQLVQLSARWYALQRCRGMKKVCGAVKLAVGFCAGPDSALLRQESARGPEDVAGAAARFEQIIQRLREERGVTVLGTSVSLSPTCRSPHTSRALTARGGTTARRPKSAPEATTLTSPAHDRRRRFELKPLRARYPIEDEADGAITTVLHEGRGRASPDVTDTLNNLAGEGHEQRPRWRFAHEMLDPPRHPMNPPPSGVRPADNSTDLYHAPPDHEQKAVFCPDMHEVTTSSKLSHMAARAVDHAARGSTGMLASRDTRDGAILRAQRWQRSLLEEMQKLEDRCTDAMAYGSLRTMVREASPTQVGHIITAAKGIGATCSLRARRYVLRLLAWLCFDQPRPANKACSNIIAYVLDRIRDDEAASLWRELSTCTGAVVLSALRSSTAVAYLAQTQRFLELATDQRPSVRAAAGVCCVACILPNPPGVPVEIDTELRSMNDVRIAIGHAAVGAGTSIAVPKEAVLLPGGRVVAEAEDAAAAVDFFDRAKRAAKGFPANWTLHPFPEVFCDSVEQARAAHFVRLTVNSEELLASLLEPLSTKRSEGTRDQLLRAIAALARSLAERSSEPEAADTESKTAGLCATLRKGLPAVVHAILMTMCCTLRRAYTWKERRAALEVAAVFASLNELRGEEGPLGVHRDSVVRAATRGKRDSVAAVREMAAQALAALESAGTEERTPERANPSVARGVRSPQRWRAVGWTHVATESDPGHFLGAAESPEKPEKKKTLDRALKEARQAAARGETRTPGRERGEAFEEIPRQEAIVRAQASTLPALGASRAPLPENHRRRSGEVDAEGAVPVLDEQSSLNASSWVSKGRPGLEGERASSDVTSPTASERLREPGKDVDLDGDEEEHRDSEPQQTEPEYDRQDSCNRPSSDAGASKSLAPREDDGEPPVHLPSQENPARERDLAFSSLSTIGVQRQTHAQAMAASNLQSSVTGFLSPEVPILTASQNASLPASEERGTSIRVLNATTQSSPPASATRGEEQTNTVRLLRTLSAKTDSIAVVLNRLDQRLVGMEKNLTQDTNTADSRSRSPPRRKKRPRSSGTARSCPVAAGTRGEDPTPLTKMSANARGNVATTGAAGPCRTSARAATYLRGELKHLLMRGEVDAAFRCVLGRGSERDILRLMGAAGGPALCRRRLGLDTRNRLFVFVARTISTGRYAEHVLPWVFELVRAGDAHSLTLAVRMQLAGALHGLAASPTDHGILAARLGPYMSLASVGQTSTSDANEGDGIFRSLGLVGGDR